MNGKDEEYIDFNHGFTNKG